MKKENKIENKIEKIEEVPVVKVEAPSTSGKTVIAHFTSSFTQTDLNELRDKLNEVIDRINK